MSDTIDIKPMKTKEYTVKQRKYEIIKNVLPARSILCGASGSGKTV